jgi:peptide/nickel transport system substrate-binding protein
MRSSSRRADAKEDVRARGRIGYVVVLLGALVALSVAISACGGGGGGTTGESSAEAGEPVRGGKMVFARSQDADVGLNPINAPSNGSIFIIQQIFDQLVEMGAGSEVVPGLATSWNSSNGGKTWTFKLREAQFSNGEPVTGEDVKFSLERFADPKVNVSYPTLGEAIDNVQVVDPHTVKVNLSRVDGAFLDNIAMFAAAIEPKNVVEKVGDKAFSENPIGSGPFEVKEYKRGQKTVLQPNPHYWRKGQPYLAEVVFEFVPDANTRVLKVRSGEADVADAIPYNQVASLESSGEVSVEVAKALSWTSIFLNLKKPPLGDKKIRQALNYATPKEEILKSVYFGDAEIANSNIPPLKYWDESIEPYPFDLEKAEELMAESSSPNGFKLELLIPAGEPVVKQTAEILKEEWGKIGVNVEIVEKDLGALESAWFEGKGGMSATFAGGTLSSDTLSDDEIAIITLEPEGGLNSLGTFYNNPKVNKLLSEASSTINDEVRAEKFAEVQKIALEDAPAVPLFFTKSVTAVRDNVKNFQTYPIGWWPLREAWVEP